MRFEPSTWEIAMYVTGWALGWLLLWRTRPLPAAPPGETTSRPACAVVIPARDEQDSLSTLVAPLVTQLRPGDELVVVDDQSTDATAAVAARLGARVVAAPPVTAGSLGKPNACWAGASATSAPTLVFIDADVRPAPDLLDRVGAAVASHPGAVVSVQPWHATGSFAEQASVLCNVTALMGSGAFTVFGDRISTRVAFGPVLALQRVEYERVGGHAADGIRSKHTEDIAIARAVGTSQLFTGRPDTAFRMYPGGLRQTMRGWIRNIATGARLAPWWLTLGTAAWVWSLAGGWWATPLCYPLSAVQVWVLGRRAASVHPLTALLYPVAVAAFAVVFLRSALALLLRRPVEWKGRQIDVR